MPLAHADGQIKLDYPRTYRASRWLRAFYVVFGGFLAIPSLLGLGVLLYSVLGGQIKISVAFGGLAFCIFFALVGIDTFLGALRAKVVLFEDRIEIQKTLRKYVLLRADIAGRRVHVRRVRGGKHRHLALVPRQADKAAIELDNNLKTDAFFKEWLDSLPDLDA
jgi:hypothetical protein